jgi:hypothetical protein
MVFCGGNVPTTLRSSQRVQKDESFGADARAILVVRPRQPDGRSAFAMVALTPKAAGQVEASPSATRA